MSDKTIAKIFRMCDYVKMAKVMEDDELLAHLFSSVWVEIDITSWESAVVSEVIERFRGEKYAEFQKNTEEARMVKRKKSKKDASTTSLWDNPAHNTGVSNGIKDKKNRQNKKSKGLLDNAEHVPYV